MPTYRHVRGDALKIKVVINAPTADFARVYIKKTDGTVVLPEMDMSKESDGVYVYRFQTSQNMSLTTYNVFSAITLGGMTSRIKTSFSLVAD